MRRDLTIQALESLCNSKPRALLDPWSEVSYGYQRSHHDQSERCEMGVDLMRWNVLLDEVPEALWSRTRWRHVKTTSAPGHVGRVSLPNSNLRLRLFRFPGADSRFSGEAKGQTTVTPRDFHLTIRLNPTTLVQNHNVHGDDASLFLRAIIAAQKELEEWGVTVDLFSAPLAELHLTRDISFLCHRGSNEESEQRQWEAINQVLRLMEWGKAPYARDFTNYSNATPEQPAQNKNKGLSRGSKLNRWVVYDKVQEYQDKGKQIKPISGRMLRVEWRIRNSSQIEQHLGIKTAWQLAASFCSDWNASDMPAQQILEFLASIEDDIKSSLRCEELTKIARERIQPIQRVNKKKIKRPCSIYSRFDRGFYDNFFLNEQAYTQRMPRLDTHLVDAIAPFAKSELQRQCLQSLREGNPVTHDEAEILIIVLNDMGADKVRQLLRKVFDLDSPERHKAQASRRKHDNHAKILAKLRAGARYNAHHTWSDFQEQVLIKWDVRPCPKPPISEEDLEEEDSEEEDLEEDGYPKDISTEKFRELASSLLKKITLCPHAEDDLCWVHLTFGRKLFIPADLLNIYRKMRDLEEQLSSQDGDTTLSREQWSVACEARKLKIIACFPLAKDATKRVRKKKE